VGPRILTLTNNFSATNPSNATYTATSGDICTFTAKASGNWNAAGTWTPSGCTGGGHSTPAAGDTVTITGYSVVCSTGTCYAGTAPANNTTYDLTIAQSGSGSGVLEVSSGATLFVTGNFKLNSSAGASPTHFAVFKLDTGATFVHDNANGSVQYRGYGGASANWNNIVFGTQGDVCTFSSNFGYSCQTKYIGADVAGGYNPVLFAMGTLYDDITYQIYGSSFRNCGASAVPCLDYGSSNNSNGYANAGVIDVEDSVFDTTSTLGSAGTYYASALTKLTWARNREMNDIAGWLSANPTHMLGLTTKISACNVYGNYFHLLTNSSMSDYMYGCNFSGNVFANGFYNNHSATYPLGSFSNNLHMIQPGGISFTTVYWPMLYNIYTAETSGPSSAHMGPAFGDPGPYTQIGNIGDKYNTQGSEGHCGLGQDSSAPVKAYLLDNIAIMGVGGDPACQWWDIANGNTSGPAAVGYLDHNGENGLGYIGWLVTAGHGSLYYPTNAALASLRANIGWSPTTGTGNLQFADLQGSGTAPNTVVNANTVVDWNNDYNGNNSTLFGTGGASSNCSPSTFNGTPYQVCSVTASPGSHQTTLNPKYVDTTRRLDTWAYRVMGQAQSPAGARQAMWQCASIRACIDGAWAWIRRGWQPTNIALKGSAHDGKIIGLSGTLGSGYSGTCGVTITPRDAWDLGGTIAPHAASATCTFSGGVPQITLVSGGAHYRVATPATVAVTGTCTGGCVAASLVPIIQPSDIGPVSIAILPSAF
jgi:hypothetical protein